MFGILSPKKEDGPAERLKKHKERCKVLRDEQSKKLSALDALNKELKTAVEETAATAVSIVGQLNGCGLKVKKVRAPRRKRVTAAAAA